MIQITELRLGSLLYYGNVPSQVNMLDGPDESILIALPSGEFKFIGPEGLHEMHPMFLSADVLKRCPLFTENSASIRMGSEDWILRYNGQYVVLMDKDEHPVIHYYNVRALHQLQQLYTTLTGMELETCFEQSFDLSPATRNN